MCDVTKGSVYHWLCHITTNYKLRNLVPYCFIIKIKLEISIKCYDSVCVCCIYLACKSHLFCTMLCNIIYGLSGFAIFFVIILHIAQFLKKDYMKSVLICSESFIWNFLISLRIQYDIVINVLRSSCTVPTIFVQFLNKLEFSLHLLTEIPTIKFHENPASRIWVVPCRQPDRHDKANSRFLKLCKHA